LCGRRPYAVDGLNPAEFARVICEMIPPPPSAALASAGVSPAFGVAGSDGARGRPIPPADKPSADEVSMRRSTTIPALRARLPGDLAGIVQRAIQKDRGLRSPSVEQFADDIRRYLENRPVAARVNTLPYRAGKFVQRHRIGVGASAAAAVLCA